MPISPRQNLLCSYRYDALDRSISWAPVLQADIQRFYCKDHLVTEFQDVAKRSIFQYDDHVLAQRQQIDDKIDIILLTTDLQGSVLNTLDAHRVHPIAYTPYGHSFLGNCLLNLLGFNGERPDLVTGHYHLGHGYRQFNPVLMRFNSPDSLSPFGKGGLNAYAYCVGDPVNRTDPTGHISQFVKNALKSGSLSKWPRHVSPKKTQARSAYQQTPILNIKEHPTPLNRPSNTTRNASEPPPPLKTDINILDYVGTHGSTEAHRKSLTAGLHSNFMNSAGGLSSGPGFYVSPTRRTAVDFSEAAASHNNGTPRVYEVYVEGFRSMIPGHHYRFGTMGEGGLTYRSLNEMEIVFPTRIYRRISVHANEIRGTQVLPRASEAPF